MPGFPDPSCDRCLTKLSIVTAREHSKLARGQEHGGLLAGIARAICPLDLGHRKGFLVGRSKCVGSGIGQNQLFFKSFGF